MGRPLTNYRKAYGKLRGGTLPELGGNFRLCAVDQKRPFFLGVGSFLDLLPFKGPFPLTGALTGLTGRPLTGRLLMGRPLTNYRKAYWKLWGGTLPVLGGNFRLCAVDQKRPFFLAVGPFLDLLPFKGISPLREGPLRGDRLTGRPLTGRLLTGDTFNYRKAYGKLRGGTLPELGVDQKRPFFLRVEPFLDLLPFKGPFPLTGGSSPSIPNVAAPTLPSRISMFPIFSFMASELG